MLSRIRGKLTYANVISTFVVVILLGSGTAYATHLVVRSSDIVNGEVKTVDIANGAVTRAKLAPPEPWREVGAPGQPNFPVQTNGPCVGTFVGANTQRCWDNYDGNHNSAGFFKDPFGVVHLKGLVYCAIDDGCHFHPETQTIFVLPTGYRPAKREVQVTLKEGAAFQIYIDPDGGVRFEGAVQLGESVSLDGITFRAA